MIQYKILLQCDTNIGCFLQFRHRHSGDCKGEVQHEIDRRKF